MFARDTKNVRKSADLKEVISCLKETRVSSYSMQWENVIVFNIIEYKTVKDRNQVVLLCSDIY